MISFSSYYSTGSRYPEFLWYNKIIIMKKGRIFMETGLKAWIAAYDTDGRIELPGGWHWDVRQNGTGYLKDPDDKLCVGYDLENQTIRFGADGGMKAPGLNPWTVQEMGEKFAREHFMEGEMADAYDRFATERGERRKTYEREIRGSLTGVIQMEYREGNWTAHVDTNAVHDMTPEIETKPELTKEEGVALFNRMSQSLDVMPLRDPLGYMALSENLYGYLKDQYAFQYEDMINNIDAGFINGNGYGCEAVLNKLDVTVRKNIREYCLPEGVRYQDLKYVKATPELKDAANEFVKRRVIKTVDFEKKRSHSADSLAKDHERFLAAGEALRERIADAVLPPFTVDLHEDQDLGFQQGS